MARNAPRERSAPPARKKRAPKKASGWGAPDNPNMVTEWGNTPKWIAQKVQYSQPRRQNARRRPARISLDERRGSMSKADYAAAKRLQWQRKNKKKFTKPVSISLANLFADEEDLDARKKARAAGAEKSRKKWMDNYTADQRRERRRQLKAERIKLGTQKERKKRAKKVKTPEQIADQIKKRREYARNYRARKRQQKIDAARGALFVEGGKLAFRKPGKIVRTPNDRLVAI